jgi:hypothetical protein
VTAKKKKELNHYVIATIWQPVVMCGCKKKKPEISLWLKSYLVVWNMIANLGSK